MTIEELNFEAFKQGREQGREEGAAEIERLRALVKFAYFEGFEDGDIWGKAAEWWPTTETRAALQPKEGEK